MDRPLEELLLDHLPLAVDGEIALPAELAQALEQDEDLRARWGRWVRQARALGALGTAPAPRDLEGRVVAATQVGHRQDRAAEHLAGLPQLPAPAALERRVRHGLELPFPDTRRQAPPALDRRVEQELADLPAANVRRLTGRLSRQRAPEDLARRLFDAPGRRRRRPGLITALTVVTVLGVGGWLRFGRVGAEPAEPEVVSTATLDFEIVRLDPVSTDPAARALLAALGGFAGGVVEGSQR